MAFGKKDEVYGAQTLYRELGYYIVTRKEQYERALKYFDEAINKAPNDKRALIGRSIARAKAVQYEGAIEDIDKALELDPEDLVTLAHKSLNTYLICNFEDGLVSNLKQLPKRKKPNNFAMGVMHCNQAIENCIGERAGRPLRDHFKIIRKLAWKKARESQKPYEPKAKRKKKKKKIITSVTIEAVAPTKKKKKGVATTNMDAEIRDSLHTNKEEDEYIPKGPRFPYKPLQAYTTNIENYMASKYLESMYLDKIFLKNLKDDPGVKNPNESGTKKILHLAKHGYKTLCYKQELLRTRRPFYFIKYQEVAKLSPTMLARQQKELLKTQQAIRKDAELLLQKIKVAIDNKQTRVALEQAEKLKLICDTKQKKHLPQREEYLQEIYALVARAYLDLKRINKNQAPEEQNKRIFNMLGCPCPKEPSTDSVIHQFKDAFIDWKKQITIAESRLKKAKDSQEIAWLYHDLSRYYTELKKYELARVYARKCISEARECKVMAWRINATMLIVKINVQLHNRNDAKLEVKEAINLAKTMNNENLVEYLERTHYIIETLDFDELLGIKVLEKREKQIIGMMVDTGMKEEVSHLFRMMSVMPASRRMSVMPGVRFTDDKSRNDTKKHKRMSIMGTPKDDDDKITRRVKKKKSREKKVSEQKGVESPEADAEIKDEQEEGDLDLQ